MRSEESVVLSFPVKRRACIALWLCTLFGLLQRMGDAVQCEYRVELYPFTGVQDKNFPQPGSPDALDEKLRFRTLRSGHRLSGCYSS